MGIGIAVAVERCERMVFNWYSRCLGWIASGGVTTSISVSSSVRRVKIFQLPKPMPTMMCNSKLANKIRSKGRLRSLSAMVGLGVVGSDIEKRGLIKHRGGAGNLKPHSCLTVQ